MYKRQPYHLEGIDLNPAVSMGLALYPSEADSLEALMRLADADMYEHKKRRRCRNGTETSPSADGASWGAGVEVYGTVAGKNNKISGVPLIFGLK